MPGDVLDPALSWPDRDAYQAQATHLVGLFEENFASFADTVPADVRAAAIGAPDVASALT